MAGELVGRGVAVLVTFDAPTSFAAKAAVAPGTSIAITNMSMDRIMVACASRKPISPKSRVRRKNPI
jgi:hypothetical protein